MDLFGRYVFKQTAGALLLILLSLTTVVWLAMALRELSLLTTKGQSVALFFKMTFLALPNLMAIIAPVALLIASFHTLNRLNSDSELIVMIASGAKIWRLAQPYLLLSFILSIILIIINFYVMPKSMRTLRNYVMEVRADLISQVLRPGAFSSPERGLTFHIRDKNRAGDLLGLVVHDERDQTQIMSYLAKRGKIIKQEGRPFLVMFDGHIQRQMKSGEGVQTIAFQQYIFDLSQFGPKEGSLEYKPRERYLSELLSPDPNDSYYQRHPGKFRSEIHERFAGPLYPISFALIAIAMLGHARTTRVGRVENIIAGFGLATGLRVSGLAATNLLSAHPWAVILVYGIPLGGIAVAAYAAHFNMSPHRARRKTVSFSP